MKPRSRSADEALHASEVETLQRRIMELALERTGAQHGALFLWDPRARALALDFHMVDGLVVNLPGVRLRRRTDGRPNGIAFHVLDTNEPYLCVDSSTDPLYARYFLDVGSIAAVPIPYQGRAIGVLSVSARAPRAFTTAHLDELEALAASAATFLRRAQLDRAARERDGRPFLIKGLCPEWIEVERRIEAVAPTDAPVLVQGESGTGKELVAHAIHFNSRRAEAPLVTVNCAALPEPLFESLLFGHVRGAFTGAAFAKRGEFQKAHGGTLFLDELGELPLGLQAKVLRALDRGEVQPLGSDKAPERVDVRLICATNRDLAAEVRAGRFRHDLYYRVGVMTLALPPLRRYKDNLPVLAQVFLQEAAQRHGRPANRLAPEALALLAAYDFPGNVRELRNILEHAVILAAGEVVEAADLPPLAGVAPAAAAPASSTPAATLRVLREQWLAGPERRYLAELLDACRGNVRAAARRAGVDPVTLYRLLRRRGVSLPRARTTP
ncbi:MAG: sigma-54-dependent Fis family transcriptional regulator [Myxococcales bacterium]|nr:sigma-54-dependent Fis family transcriptional regulator [Myxococcales bacterium]